jgi:hypothetical protein
MRMESTHTLDVSRTGVRVQRSESCESGSRVWAVFRFDAAAASRIPPETLARVVRVESGACAGYRVSLQLELPSRIAFRTGARFESAHIYSAGDAVLAKVPGGDWARAGEIPACIVRVENCATATSSAALSNPLAGMSAILNNVAVRWDVPGKA